VIAKIGLILFSNLLGRGLLAMLGIRGVVLHAHFADMQLRVAGLANVEAAQWQAKRAERCTAAPADEGVGHEELKNIWADSPAHIIFARRLECRAQPRLRGGFIARLYRSGIAA
jgi:hypothetical protein